MYSPKLSEVSMEPAIWDKIPDADKARFQTKAVGKVNKACGVVSLMFDNPTDAAQLADLIAQQGADRLLDIVAIVK